METKITIEWPLKRITRPKYPNGFRVPLKHKLFDWLWTWGGASIGEFGGNRTNKIRHLTIFGFHVCQIDRNEYHDRSDRERADEYLNKWSECEKELRGLRLLLMGDSVNAEVKKVIRDSLGVDLDEGRIL